MSNFGLWSPYCWDDPFACVAVLGICRELSVTEFRRYFEDRGYALHSSPPVYAVFTGVKGSTVWQLDGRLKLDVLQYVGDNACIMSVPGPKTLIAEKDGAFVAWLPEVASQEHLTSLTLRNQLGDSCTVYRAITPWPTWKLARIPNDQDEFKLE